MKESIHEMGSRKGRTGKEIHQTFQDEEKMRDGRAK